MDKFSIINSAKMISEARGDEAEPEEDSVEDPEAKNTGKVFARELVDALLYLSLIHISEPTRRS